MRHLPIFLGLCVLFTALSGLERTDAQTVTGTILGFVLDSSGSVIPNAAVEATNSATHLSREIRTDAQGAYLLTFLPPGTYRLTASATGFKQTLRDAIQVAADERARVDITLQIGDTNQTIEVTTAAPLIQASDATVGEVIDSRTITDLPLNKRNFAGLVQLTAGVAPGRPFEAAGGVTIDNFRGSFTFNANGQRSTTNNFILDGVDNNANLFNAGGIVIEPVIDSIQEFKVSTGNFSPEFGRATGGVVSVQTKSGTNKLHGTGFEFLRNSDLDANDFFNNRAGIPIQPFRQNQFGGTVGGPVVRDKTFFFGDYQGVRVRDSNNFTSSVPLPSALQGDFSNPVYKAIYDPATSVPSRSPVVLSPFPGNKIPVNRIDPAAAALAKFYPAPNVNVNSTTLNFINNPGLQRNDDQFDTRIDHRFNEANNIFGRYSFADAYQHTPTPLLTATNPFGGGAQGNLSWVRAQSIAINYIHMWSPRLLSETRFGFTRTRLTVRPEGYADTAGNSVQIQNQRYSDLVQTIPTITLSGLTYLGPQGNVPNVSVQNNFQVAQNFSYTLSNHTLKFGGDLIRRQLNNFFTGSPASSYGFSGAYTNVNAIASPTGGNAVADFLLGIPSSASRDILFGGFGRRDLVASLYFQDDMKLSRRLTVNLGVRWDVWTPFVEVADRQSNFDMASKKLIVASSDGPLGRTLRNTDWKNFGPRFGFAYDLSGNGKMILRGGYSINYLEDLSGGNTMLTLNPPFSYSTSIANASGIIPTQTLSQGLGIPTIPPITQGLSGQVHFIDTNYRPAYAQNWSFGVQRQFGANLVLDAAYVGTKGTRLFTRVDGNQAVPGPGAVQNRRPFYSLYPGLAQLDGLLSVGNSSYHSLQLKLTKRYANGLQFLATYTNGKAIEDSEGVGGAGGGCGTQNQAQNAQNRAAEKALACFQIQQRLAVSYIYELPFGKGKPFASSGLPGRILGGWSVQGITTVESGEPFAPQMATSNLNGGTFQRPNRVCDGALDSSKRTIDHWIDTSCFVAPPLYTFGNSGRNVLIGPGIVNFDAAAIRTFTLHESLKLDFRSEFFNVSNTPHFFAPNSGVGVSSFGAISADHPDLRQIQFAMKLRF